MPNKSDGYDGEKTNPKTTKGWPPERRAAQAERLRRAKPWLKSTGPKTTHGKAIASRNNYRHGLRSAPYLAQVKLLRALLRLQRAKCKAWLKQVMPNLAYEVARLRHDADTLSQMDVVLMMAANRRAKHLHHCWSQVYCLVSPAVQSSFKPTLEPSGNYGEIGYYHSHDA